MSKRFRRAFRDKLCMFKRCKKRQPRKPRREFQATVSQPSLKGHKPDPTMIKPKMDQILPLSHLVEEANLEQERELSELELCSLPEPNNVRKFNIKTSNKCRSLPDSTWPLCCANTEEDYVPDMKTKKKKKSNLSRYSPRQFAMGCARNQPDCSHHNSNPFSQ